jgi:hypothetical protein
MNLSSELVSEFFLPIFCDNVPLSVADVAPWAKAGRKTLKVVGTWDEQRGEGRLKIVFPAALAPGERLRFSYGITLPGLFSPGKDYYNWDIEVPYFDLSSPSISLTVPTYIRFPISTIERLSARNSANKSKLKSTSSTPSFFNTR